MNKFKHNGSRKRPARVHRPIRRGRNYAFHDNGRHKQKHLDPGLFIKKALDNPRVSYTSEFTFPDFHLHKEVQKNVLSRGFTKPTPIQDKTINHILQDKDVVGIANTGTGKTAAFLLPLISKVAGNNHQKVLIITPTHELANQIQDEFFSFSKGMGMFSSLCIGGVSVHKQVQNLRRHPQFVIGTPGRIKDLEKRRILDLHQFTHIVLDEVDRMLDMGFIRDIRYIVSLLPDRRQSLFFSATIPDQIKSIMQQFLREPVTIAIEANKACHNVDQDIVKLNGRKKIATLHQLLRNEEFEKVLVFGRTKWGVRKVEAYLHNKGMSVASIHGNKNHTQRTRALELLKQNRVRILVATDVVARGIDIDDITHVINYDAPTSYDDYIHRIGRTGRAGKKGKALTFVD